jgi:hypothetical protein
MATLALRSGDEHAHLPTLRRHRVDHVSRQTVLPAVRSGSVKSAVDPRPPGGETATVLSILRALGLNDHDAWALACALRIMPARDRRVLAAALTPPPAAPTGSGGQKTGAGVAVATDGPAEQPFAVWGWRAPAGR